MSKLFDEDELDGCMDCYGEFDVTNEICLKYCGINIACACRGNADDEIGCLEEDLLGLSDVDLD